MEFPQEVRRPQGPIFYSSSGRQTLTEGSDWHSSPSTIGGQSTSLHLYISSIVGCMILKIQVHFLMLVGGTFKKFDLRFYKLGISSRKI